MNRSSSNVVWKELEVFGRDKRLCPFADDRHEVGFSFVNDVTTTIEDLKAGAADRTA